MAAFRFEFLLKVSLEEREDAAKTLQVAQSQWLTAQSKQQQIDDYRNEYRQRLTSSGQVGMSVTQWRDYQLFLVKLDTAAQQQAQEVSRLHQLYQQALRAWQECEKKVKGFEALKERHEQDEQRKALIREQKLLDEFNSRRQTPE